MSLFGLMSTYCLLQGGASVTAGSVLIYDAASVAASYSRGGGEDSAQYLQTPEHDEQPKGIAQDVLVITILKQEN